MFTSIRYLDTHKSFLAHNGYLQKNDMIFAERECKVLFHLKMYAYGIR